MLQGIVEEHQVHFDVVFVVIVFLKEPVELLLDFNVPTAVLVEFRVDVGLLRRICSHEVTKNDWICHHRLVNVFKGGFQNGTHQFFSDHDSVFFIDQSIVKYSQRFIPPKSHNRILCRELVDGGPGQTLINSTQVSQVENVVELDRSSWKKLNDLSVQFQGHVSNFRGQVLDLSREPFQMIAQNAVVDTLKVLLGWENQVESGEEGEETGIDHGCDAGRQ